MLANADNNPVSATLRPVFYMAQVNPWQRQERRAVALHYDITTVAGQETFLRAVAVPLRGV